MCKNPGHKLFMLGPLYGGHKNNNVCYCIFDEVNEGQFEFQVTEAVCWVSQVFDF